MATVTEKESKVDFQSMMEVYAKLATPGAAHKILASMAGTWNAKVKSWMEPGMPPTESSGSSEAKMILGGRFMQEEFSGDMSGNGFIGLGITGYDNHTKKFSSLWIDSMGTSMLFFEGTGTPDHKTITMESCYDDPIKGATKWRSVSKIIDDNTHLFEMFSTDRNGKEEKVMEIAYTRKR